MTILASMALGCEVVPSARGAEDPFERPCRSAAECPGRKCVHLGANPQGWEGICSRRCASNGDCQEGGICFSLGKAGKSCLASCDSDASCAEGLACVPVGVFGETACFVRAGGRRQEGSLLR